MPNACFVDTNVFLYANDRRFPEKRAQAQEWLRVLGDRNLIVINPQVMNEFANNVIRKLAHIHIEELISMLEQLHGWCTAETSGETAIQGVLIHRRYGFAFYDATLIAAALTSACDIFLSEDMSHEQRIGRLQIINPFAVAPLELLAN